MGCKGIHEIEIIKRHVLHGLIWEGKKRHVLGREFEGHLSVLSS